MKKIDSITVIPMKNKTIQVYNSRNERIYANSDIQNDTIHVSDDILIKREWRRSIFLRLGIKKP